MQRAGTLVNRGHLTLAFTTTLTRVLRHEAAEGPDIAGLGVCQGGHALNFRSPAATPVYLLDARQIASSEKSTSCAATTRTSPLRDRSKIENAERGPLRISHQDHSLSFANTPSGRWVFEVRRAANSRAHAPRVAG
jgi:hypothetical protein